MERRSSDVEIALLHQDMDELKKAMTKLEGQVAGLLEAWNTATGLVKFVKWAATLAAAVGILWAFLSGYIHK
jgi:hypothetical protein